MSIKFYKYHGTGNDFVLIDNRDKAVQLTEAQIANICHRRYGVGADGLMLLEPCADADFRMVYYNADGRESSMCGNGGRCISAFAKSLGIVTGNKLTFMAIDGLHEAEILPDGSVALGMKDVENIHLGQGFALLDTGSPHHVAWVEDVQHTAVFAEGRRIRQAAGPAGVNVNFAQRKENEIAVRTYERGVEDETLSCGTGVTAVAIASVGTQIGEHQVGISTPGGFLTVSFFKPSAETATRVVLKGPAARVFEGLMEG